MATINLDKQSTPTQIVALATGLGEQAGTPANPLPISTPPLRAGTDRSGRIVTANTAQVLALANPNRARLSGQNISTADLWMNEIGGTAAANAPGSYRVASGQSFSVSTNRAISIVGATAGQAFTATET